MEKAYSSDWTSRSEVRQLRCTTAAVDHGSIRRAAEAIGFSSRGRNRAPFHWILYITFKWDLRSLLVDYAERFPHVEPNLIESSRAKLIRVLRKRILYATSKGAKSLRNTIATGAPPVGPSDFKPVAARKIRSWISEQLTRRSPLMIIAALAHIPFANSMIGDQIASGISSWMAL
jgi:hypothetical protein